MCRIVSEIIALVMLSVFPMISYAHGNDSLEVWTLERCVEHALEYNIKLRSERLAVRERDISLSDSKWAFAPRISASSGYNLSIGRVLDETTYDFVTNETVGSSTASISGSILLFSWMSLNWPALKGMNSSSSKKSNDSI